MLERSGRWFVSPTRTVLGTLEDILEGVAPDQAGAFVDRLAEGWEIYRPEASPEAPPDAAVPSLRPLLGLGRP